MGGKAVKVGEVNVYGMTVISVSVVDGSHHKIVRCFCGNTISGVIRNFRTVRSCGCSRHTKSTENCKRRATHGMSGTPEHWAWKAIKRRCCNTEGQDAHLYALKGIKVCDRWLNSFENFYADMGPRPSSRHSIERYDSDGDYCPENCGWELPVVQANNTTRNKVLQVFGRSLTMAQAAVEYGIDYSTLRHRIYVGWPDEVAVSTPTNPKRAEVYYEVDGELLLQSELSRVLGVAQSTLAYWRRQGLSTAEILERAKLRTKR